MKISKKLAGFVAALIMLWAVSCRAEEVLESVSFRLHYKTEQDTGKQYYVKAVTDRDNVAMTFKKEPAFSSDRTIRGVLQIDGTEGAMGFAWDRDAKALYLDLNRNLDLTDDPVGTASPRYTNIFGGSYSEFHIRNGNLVIPEIIEVHAVEEWGTVSVYANIYSSWEGRIVLNGQPWLMTVFDNLDGVIGTGDRVLLDKATAEPKKYKTQWPGGWWEMQVPRRLTLAGRAYDVTYQFASRVADANDKPATGTKNDSLTEEPDLIATFTESRAPMASVDIEGDGLDYVVLETSDADGGLVIIEHPMGKAMAPPGKYIRQRSVLRRNASLRRHFLSIGLEPQNLQTKREEPFEVTENGPNVLRLGAPLVQTVTAERRSNKLYLEYHLQGRGAEDYAPWAPQGAATFTVSGGLTRGGSGRFFKWG